MRIAVFSLTRDRLEYTRRAFASLRENAGHPFDHYIYDNGSRDGTLDWLLADYWNPTVYVTYSEENKGISVGSNNRLYTILHGDYDLISKVDNDAEILTPGILARFAEIYSDPAAQRWVLGPYCQGLNNQPRRGPVMEIGGYAVARTAIVGGIFKVIPAAMAREFMADGGFDESLPRARLQDDQFAEWRRQHGYFSGYVDSLQVSHIDGTDGQARKYPEYFAHKFANDWSAS